MTEFFTRDLKMLQERIDELLEEEDASMLSFKLIEVTTDLGIQMGFIMARKHLCDYDSLMKACVDMKSELSHIAAKLV